MNNSKRHQPHQERHGGGACAARRQEAGPKGVDNLVHLTVYTSDADCLAWRRKARRAMRRMKTQLHRRRRPAAFREEAA